MIKWLLGNKAVKEVLQLCKKYDEIYRAYRAIVAVDTSDNSMLDGIKGTFSSQKDSYVTSLEVLATDISVLVQQLPRSDIDEIIKKRNGYLPSIKGILEFSKRLDPDKPKVERIVSGLKQPRLNPFYVKRNFK